MQPIEDFFLILFRQINLNSKVGNPRFKSMSGNFKHGSLLIWQDDTPNDSWRKTTKQLSFQTVISFLMVLHHFKVKKCQISGTNFGKFGFGIVSANEGWQNLKNTFITN